ncbi:putative disease resistance RPP13-like protein 1 [Beta vulgaris subsp. vulgaris]|uniref:putative disease resistance RPP13-like protein 1 n=1 Tax=Beta vulgaris subsp. vulgaris TaxID=3555 RepID=UPI002036B597|nr:putative disease resistance RPP13-like protein 1 [Beta vulgaris subsp. vulgaris]
MEAVSTYAVVPFISGLFNVLLDRLAPQNMRESLMGHSTAHELSELRKSMLRVRRVINDAEQKQDTDPDVKNWVNEVKHAVYDAEDLLDEIHTETLRKRMESGNSSQVISSITATFGRMVSVLDPFHQGTVSKIHIISKRFEGFSQLIDVLHLKSGLENPRVLSSSRLTSSFVDESMICGRDSEKELFIQLLQDGVPKTDERGSLIKGSRFPEGSIRTFAIIGMPGIGKTTLAQLIFNDPRVDAIFDFKSWTCVPEVFDVIKIMKSILNLLLEPNQHLEDLESNQTSLRKRVAKKRILIVLDDVWDENMIVAGWQALLISLKSAAPGSTIIVTTSNEDIAKMLRPFYIHLLRELSHDDCWTLFRMHAFGDPCAAPEVKLEATGRELVAKCGGLPLAIKALAGLLCFSSDAKEWEIIKSSNMWDFPSCKKEILPALLLSYNYLPPHLKRCFAYCSIFPKNYNFDKEKLVLLWMAEGFIEQERNGNRRLEDIGSIYFRDLLARSFFQMSYSKKNHFVMHDLIHDLAAYIMGEFGLMLEPNISHVVMGTPRHISLKQSKYETAERFGPTACTDRLRTFLPIGSFSSQYRYYISTNLLHSMQMFGCLRLLSLSGYSITSIPPSIGSLKHLRYLDCSCTFIKELPESICDLLNLQTLLLYNCEQLSILPVMMRNLIHLRHLNIHGTCIEEMPEHIGRLSCLQTLTDFVASDSHGSSIRELGELSQLRGNLRISGLENVVAEADAFAANLRGKEHLVELALVQQDDCSVTKRQHEQLMDVLKPHANLERLIIDHYEGKKFPNWIGDDTFCNLKVLHLKHCTKCVALPSLGQLPVLTHLLIKDFDNLATLGAEFYGQHSASSSPFRSLMTLKFEGLQQLKKWCRFEGNSSPYPYLQELYVTDCRELEGDLPLELPSLVVLNIRGCQKLSGTLSNAPLLRELLLIAFGRVDLASITRFTHLTTLILEQVQDDSIAKVQEAVRHLTSLGKLTISTERKGTMVLHPWHFPASIRSMTVLSDEQLIFDGASQLQHIYLQHISSPLRFPAGYFQLLHLLEIATSDGLTELPIILDGDDLGFTSLHDLYITQCKRLTSFPAEGFLAPNLTTLNLYGCDSLQSPPKSMLTNFPSLRCLSFGNCSQLDLLPEDGFPLHLLTLHINGCHKLQTLPEAMSSCMSLEWLDIENCTAFVLFPASGLPAQLQKLRIYDCESLASLPDRLCSNLKHLDIWKCPRLESFPPGGLPASLESMQIFGCEALIRKYADWQLARLIFLKELSIGGLGDVESFPADGSLPTKLNILKIDQFSRLRSVNCKELQRISALREFEIQRCPTLVLFSDDLPHSLCRLTIRQSLSMVKRCLEPDGYYVDKISHITCLELDS